MEGRSRGLLLVFLAAFLFTQALCQTPDPRVSCPVGHDAAWRYNRPGQWGGLCPHYSTCAVGERQSPIDIPPIPPNGRTATKLQLDLNRVTVNLIRAANNYLTLPTPKVAGTLTWRSQLYDLDRLEFHAPSEHTIGGKQAALEVQLYFSRVDRRGTFRAAVAFLYNVAPFACDDPFLSSVIPALPRFYRCECGNNRTESYQPFGEECDLGSGNANVPNRCRKNCKLPKCGDGITDADEECDAGAANNVAGKCRTHCTKPYCGDGILDDGEVCDSGAFWWEGSGCTATCKSECGDACLQKGEDCDYGIPSPKHSNAQNATYQSTCRLNCLWARCGDGILDAPMEQCDGGNYRNATSTGGSFAPNDCRPDCTLPKCGDNIVDSLTEECDGGLFCSSNCTWQCGDGTQQSWEQCDNGTLNSNAPWTDSSLPPPCRSQKSLTQCQLAHCGDNITDWNEQCDDAGNTTRCYSDCTLRCGNRIVDSGEECDNGDPRVYPNRTLDGNSDTRPNACRTNCKACSCGDKVVDPLGCEQCDPGLELLSMKPNACRPGCKLPVCGDNVVDDGEQCDDGNNIDDDGCSCCRIDCGNGIKQGNEVCDDGALNSNTFPDRCRLDCNRASCGDGVTDSTEECDPASGHVVGCSDTCTKPFCGDGVLQKALGEECDNGADNSFTAINGCSPLCTLNICGQTLTNNQADLQLLAGNANPVIGAFHYVGSETHPPCTQNVLWFIAPSIRTLSPKQYAWFTSVISKNSRPTQALLGRRPTVAPATGIWNPTLDRRNYPVCGNGIVELGEECDNKDQNSNTAPDACRLDCKASRCGDGVRDANEQCDSESYCTKTCKIIRSLYPLKPRTADLCEGTNQSPIRLPKPCAQARALNLNHPANIRYSPTPIVLFNTGKQLLFSVLSSGTFHWRGTSYALKTIQFVSPSEHHLDSKQFPLEVQLIHTSQTPGVTRTAALSVFFDETSAKNAFLQPLLDRLPRSNCQCGNGIREDMMVGPDAKIWREECDFGQLNSDSQPNGCRTNCRMAYCGDGVIDMKEQCDKGGFNADAPNHCRTNCMTPYCGDGIVDDQLGEVCDDGANVNGDGCSSSCQLECGDGELTANEVCDNGDLNSDHVPDACRLNCKPAKCGDGTVDSGEECDSGSLNSTVPDACRADCTRPTCGDRVTDPAYGEQCDGTPGCTSTCQKLCGNGRVDSPLEECDNGIFNSDTQSDACRTNCLRPRCGDGVTDPSRGEQCDSGAKNTSQCTGCIIRCGNGILELGEDCDNGVLNSDTVPNACRTTCKFASCGDNVLDRNEECDNGKNNSLTADSCRPWCARPRCGDKVVDSKETCDDGNNLDGDGCSSLCMSECGNGVVEPGEVCDQGSQNSDTVPGACRKNCKWPICGDSVTDPGEECDNGPLNANAPNACRPDCKLPKCGDGFIDHFYGEVCDQGGRNSLTSIDGCSPDCQPNYCSQSIAFNVSFDPSALIPKTPGTFWYQGSSTSSPCTENVDWFVFTNPQPISSCQLAQFRRAISGNNRCLQARNGRPVTFLEVTTKCGDGIIEGNEECDDGPDNSDYAPNACRRDCRRAHCGDGVRDQGEGCDGTPNCGENCQLSCARPAPLPVAPGSNSSRAPTPTGTKISVNFANILAH